MTNSDHSGDSIIKQTHPEPAGFELCNLCPLIGQLNIITQWRLVASCVWVTG